MCRLNTSEINNKVWSCDLFAAHCLFFSPTRAISACQTWTGVGSCVYICVFKVCHVCLKSLRALPWLWVAPLSLLAIYDFFFPTSHLVCLFKSNKRTETDRSSADDRDGSWVGQRARTHTQARRHEGNRWKRPRYVASAGARPGGQAPLASLGVHWYLMFWQTLKCMFECRQCCSTLLGKVKPVWELLHKCPSLVDGKCKSSFIANYRTPHLLWKYSLAFLTEIKYTSF